MRLKRFYFLAAVFFFAFLSIYFLHYRASREVEKHSAIVGTTFEVISEFENLSSLLLNAKLNSLLEDNRANNAIYTALKANEPVINKSILKLESIIIDSLNLRRVDSIKRRIDYFQTPSFLDLERTKKLEQLNQLYRIINRSIDRSQDLLAIRTKNLLAAREELNIWVIILGCIGFTILCFTSWIIIKQSTRADNAERFFYTVLNTSENGVITYQSIKEGRKIVDFKLLFINKYAQKIVGKHYKEVIGKKMTELFPGSKKPDFFQQLVLVVQKNRPYKYEIYSENLDKWFDVFVNRLSDGLTIRFYDVTSLKQTEHQLKNKIIELEESNVQLEQYAFVASHDLQEPLRKIRTFSGMITEQEKDLKPSVSDKLNKINVSATRLSTLIHDLLEFSRLTKDERTFEPIDLNGILKDVLSDFELLIQQKKAIVKVSEMPVVEANKLQMNQLFYNLLNNALKFAKEDATPIINVSCRLVDEEKLPEYKNLDERLDYYEVMIEDNGIGFNEEYSQQIFEVFKRLHNQYDYQGSGIGLAICKKIVFNHHGDIYAESNINHGSTFYILLPAHQPKDYKKAPQNEA